MKIVNLTPHTIHIIGDDDTVIREYPSSGCARVETTREHIGMLDGVPLVSSIYGDVVGLPSVGDDVAMYIVSAMVRQALPDRTDLVCPDTSPQGAVRNEKGQIIGTRGFIK